MYMCKSCDIITDELKNIESFVKFISFLLILRTKARQWICKRKKKENYKISFVRVLKRDIRRILHKNIFSIEFNDRL